MNSRQSYIYKLSLNKLTTRENPHDARKTLLPNQALGKHVTLEPAPTDQTGRAVWKADVELGMRAAVYL